jgi:hypothetical protein
MYMLSVKKAQLYDIDYFMDHVITVYLEVTGVSNNQLWRVGHSFCNEWFISNMPTIMFLWRIDAVFCFDGVVFYNIICSIPVWCCRISCSMIVWCRLV